MGGRSLRIAALVAVGAFAVVATAGGATRSPLTINSPISATGDLTFTASDSPSPGDDLTVNASVTSTSGGTITLTAGDHVVLNSGPVQSTGGSANLVRLEADHEGAGVADGVRGHVSASASGGNILAGNLVVRSGEFAQLLSTANDVDKVAGAVTVAGENFSYVDADDVAIDTVDGVTGVSAGSGGTAGVSSVGSGAITVAAPENGDFSLTLATDGATAINAPIGGTTPLTALTTAAGGTTAINANVTTTGVQTYNDAATLAGGVTLTAPSVVAGGTFGGTGTLTGSIDVQPGATLAPGGSPGCLSVDTLALNSGATYAVELNGTTRCTNYDSVTAQGGAGLGGASLIVSVGFTPTPGDTFTIMLNTSADPGTGMFNGLPEGASFPAGGTQFTITYAGGDGNDVDLVAQGPATAVAIAWFTASRGVVRWRTGTEAGLLGFNVFRGTKKLNAKLIRARGGAGGHAYRFADRTARAGRGYVYRLQLIGVDGRRRWASVRASPSG